MNVPVAMIAAVAENGVIGAANAIPWRLPTDFAWFKRMTLGKPLVMGRKTFESIGRPLPGRTSIVITRHAEYRPEGVVVVHDLDEALDVAQAIAARDGAAEVMIGGGGELYRQAMPIADRLYITHVALAPEGDVRFPAIDPAEWGGEDVAGVVPGPRDTASFRVRLYTRQSGRFR